MNNIKPIAQTKVHALAISLAIVLSAVSARAGEKVIFQFNQTQGQNPYTGVISDSAGNFYGTVGGGAGKCPLVYELSPGSSGNWIETVLYTFTSQNCFTDGLYPVGALTMDNDGNLYGTESSNLDDGTGQIYELAKGANGAWTYSVLHTFSSKEGAPYGDLAWDSAGNLYGATGSPFTTFSGEVFKLSPQPDGTWKENILYTFPSSDGVSFPIAGVVLDSQGNLYGPSGWGLNHSQWGGVYELSPQSNGTWTLSVAYSFNNNGAFVPNSRLVFDSQGNLYGTTFANNNGQIFQLRPVQGGGWKETVLHSFNKTAGDGRWPVGNPIFDSKGNLFGTTLYGGYGCSQEFCGTVYKLTPQSDGTWKESVAHAFESAGDGSQPRAGLYLNSSGNLYGTTYFGGSRNGYGTLYQITQ
jgi:hypothetical protein